MFRSFPPIAASLSLVAALPVAGRAQSAGISTETTLMMDEVSHMGGPTIKPETLPRSLTMEEGDDPTVAEHPAAHEASAAARKAAQKGERLARKKKHLEAAAMYREATEADPLYFEAWNNLALELDAAGRKDEAIATLRRLTQLAPEHVFGFTNLATLLCQRKQYADAEAVSRQALKLHNYSFKANYMLGTVLIDEGHWNEEAKTKLEYAEVKYPEAKALLARWPAKAN